MMPVMRVSLIAAVIVTVLAVGGCASGQNYLPLSSRSDVHPVSGELRTQSAVELPGNNTVSAETAAAAGALVVFGQPVQALGLSGPVFSPLNAAALYIVYDPLAPNWTIQEREVAKETFHLALRAKNFRTGGDGEAAQIINRRALQLQRERGYTAYRILDYVEGIESSTPFTHRYSEGTIQLVKAATP